MEKANGHVIARPCRARDRGSGIGRTCTEVLANEGATVLIVDRNPEGSSVASQLEQADQCVKFVQTDHTNESDIRIVAHTAQSLLGRLHSVVACARISGPVGQVAAEVPLEKTGTV
ncbi:SDR family NAD(P)-dependent oxidoreductase [Citricoccus alkalitolerans]|uniref:SDR family NAD(P)-dependent oxidoreductase n=1 Tax=Citricoccus alkalitolerans TaxID=246603 RepID=A0ABV8Y0Q4_9MICC